MAYQIPNQNPETDGGESKWKTRFILSTTTIVCCVYFSQRFSILDFSIFYVRLHLISGQLNIPQNTKHTPTILSLFFSPLPSQRCSINLSHSEWKFALLAVFSVLLLVSIFKLISWSKVWWKKTIKEYFGMHTENQWYDRCYNVLLICAYYILTDIRRRWINENIQFCFGYVFILLYNAFVCVVHRI